MFYLIKKLITMYFMRKFASILEVVKVIAIVFIAAVIIRVFVFQPFVVEGSSMEPNYFNGEYLLIEKLSYRFGEPKRGDVVVFRYPNNPNINYIKRIIGLPGDNIRIEDGLVFINGQVLDEPYLADNVKTLIQGSLENAFEINVPSGHYLMLGDNRNQSSDSRDGWTVSEGYIVGRSAITVYPKR